MAMGIAQKYGAELCRGQIIKIMCSLLSGVFGIGKNFISLGARSADNLGCKNNTQAK